MKKILFLALLVSMSVIPVRAVEPGLTNTKTVKEVKENRTAIQQQRCELIESRLNFRINQYEQNRDRHYSVFQGVRKRVNDLITKFENRGCDVSSLKTDITTFDKLIADFSASFRESVTAMQATRENRCGESEGAFASSVQTSRAKSLALRQQSQAVHAFFKNTIQPALTQKAKTCQPSPKPTADTMRKGDQ